MKTAPYASILLNLEANAHRGRMDHLNSVAFFKEEFDRSNSKVALFKASYHAILAILSSFGEFLLNTPLLSRWRIHHLNNQIALDQSLLPPDQTQLIQRLSAEAFKGRSEDLLLATQLGTSTYATTYIHFAPVIYDWTLSLMKRSSENGQHLVFMARDGLAAYRMALEIKKNVPQLQSLPISYVYLSRKVVRGNRDHLKSYLHQELNSSDKSDPKYLFVDIGFLGSMCADIQSALKETVKEACCEFEFLISTGNIAPGFAGTIKQNLRAVKSAGKNRAVYWMEDTHQGVVKSPKELVKNRLGQLAPDTDVENKIDDPTLLAPTHSIDTLCREAAQKAIVDFVQERDHLSDFDAHSGAPQLREDLRRKFDDWLVNLRLRRDLYIKHS